MQRKPGVDWFLDVFYLNEKNQFLSLNQTYRNDRGTHGREINIVPVHIEWKNGKLYVFNRCWNEWINK